MKEIIHNFIANGGDFNATALALYAWQRQHNPAYDRFCGAVSPQHWQDIPAVPVSLFRDISFVCFPEEDTTATFFTSGTTTGRRGVVRLKDTDIYNKNALLHATRCLGALPKHGISLVSPAVDSSLGHMCREFVPGMPNFFSLETGVDILGVWNALERAKTKIFVPGTAFAFADLMASRTRPCPLPKGSIIMVTGGFKGRRMSVNAIEMEDALRCLFPNALIVGEYGMTELSSQLWSVPLGGPFVLPPWMKAMTVDPATGIPAQTGLLRFFDLSNHQTAMAIETMDVGTIHPGGRVTLHGRLPGAIARGCSLTVEDILNPPKPPQRPVPVPATAPRAPSAPVDWVNDMDEHRVHKVIRALQEIRQHATQPLSDGLSKPNATVCLHNSIDAITAAGLRQELATPGIRPRRVSVICARGVFTAPMEWVALLAAAGCSVHIKAPTSAPDFVFALADAFAAQGLPVHASTSRDLMNPDAILAFGSDETMLELQDRYPTTHLSLYGHRFSVAWITQSTNKDLIQDIVLFDGRGCMAPAAIFTNADPNQLANAIAADLAIMAKKCPRGHFDPALGPEWRRRVGMARINGRAIEGNDWAVLVSDPAGFTPMALPRLVVIHPVNGIDDLHQHLLPWRNHFSSLATDDTENKTSAVFQEICGWFPRISKPGRLQMPPFPRKHDGRPMLGSLLQPEAQKL